MIDAGFFGDLYYAECDYFSGNWEKWYPGYDWVKTREKGGSALPPARGPRRRRPAPVHALGRHRGLRLRRQLHLGDGTPPS